MESPLISLAILFLFALVGGIIATKLKQPVIIGLLLIGALIGPNAFNFVKDQGIIDLMIQFGTILLLFAIGLEFVIPKLVKIGIKAMMLGLLKIGIIFFMTYEILILTGISQKIAVIFGIILSFSGTVVIIKILQSKGLYHERNEMPILVGMLLLEDLFAVIILTLISSVQNSSNILPVLENFAISLTLMAIIYLVTLKVAQKTIHFLLRNSGDEVITFMALGLCVGFSYLAYLFGLSPAIGAFLAGSIIASLEEVKIFEHAIKPYTLTFSSLFFISIGTMVNFKTIELNMLMISAFLALIIISRLVSVGAISYLFANFSKEQTIFSSIAMISVSEFSLLIAQAANKLNLGMDFVSITASIIFLTAMMMSLMISHYPRLSTILYASSPKSWMFKPESMSRYMKMLFDSISVENCETRKLKKEISTIMIHALVILLLAAGGRRLINIFTIAGTWQYYTSLLAIIAAIIAISYFSYKQLKSVYNTLVIILANIEYSRNLNTSRYVLNKLIITLTLFIIAIYLPGVLIIFGNLWLNLIPLTLIIISFFNLIKVTHAVHNINQKVDTFPQYKKCGKVNLRVEEA